MAEAIGRGLARHTVQFALAAHGDVCPEHALHLEVRARFCAALGGLQRRPELVRVQWRHPHVVIAREHERRGIAGSGARVVHRRIGE
jgi:hypothetical protein